MSDKKQDKSQCWCFTLNNWTIEEYEKILAFPCDYIIVGKEVGAEGTPHLQGYIRKQSQIRFNALKKLMPRAHIEIARLSPENNIQYCSKDKNYVEIGQRPVGQGKRTDIEIVRDVLKATGRISKVVEIAVNLQQIKTAETIIKYIEPKRDFKPNVIWIYGASGLGKTRRALDLFPDAYRKSNSTGQWWDGYDAHPDVVIDDVKNEDQKYYLTLLELLDRYECRIQVKGGTRQFLAKNIVLTSLWHPDRLFGAFDEAVEIKRRIDEIIHLE